MKRQVGLKNRLFSISGNVLLFLLFFLLIAFSLLIVLDESLTGFPVLQLREINGDDVEPWVVLEQFMSLPDTILPAGHEAKTGTTNLPGSKFSVHGLMRLKKGSLAYIRLCDDPPGPDVRLSSRPDFTSAALDAASGTGGTVIRDKRSDVPFDPSNPVCKVSIVKNGESVEISVNNVPVARRRCSRPGPSIRVPPGLGTAILSGWTATSDGKTSSQSVSGMKLLMLTCAALLALLCTAGFAKTPWPNVARTARRGIQMVLLRSLSGLYASIVRGSAFLSKKRTLSAISLTFVLQAPFLIYFICLDEPGLRPERGSWKASKAQATPGFPVSIGNRRSENILLTAYDTSDPGADCHVVFRWNQSKLNFSYTIARGEFVDWSSVSLSNGSFYHRDKNPVPATGDGHRHRIRLNVEEEHGMFKSDDRVIGEVFDLAPGTGIIWLVSRNRTCRLENINLSSWDTRFENSLKASIAWVSGICALAVLLVLSGLDGRSALKWIFVSSSMAIMALVLLVCLTGRPTWRLTLVLLAAMACFSSSVPAGNKARSKTFRALARAVLFLTALILLDSGLFGLPGVRTLKKAATLSSQDYMLYDVPIGTRSWYEFAEMHVFKGRAYRPGKTGMPRILCMGSSTTWGTGASNPAMEYPSILERKLEENFGMQMQVINAGVPGYTSIQVRMAAEKEIPALAPGIVIVELGYNDCNRLIQPASHYKPPGKTGNDFSFLRHSSLWLVFEDMILSGYRWTTAVFNGIFYRQGVDPEDFANNLRAIAGVCKKMDTRVVFVIEPRIRRMISGRYDRCKVYDDIMRSLKSSGEVEVLDPMKQWKREDVPYLFIDQVHMNDRGYDLLGGFLAQKISSYPGPDGRPRN
ncbi:MAG: SGNH/GDSL hydrolase family protein [Deltaproteobacteria bacterium]|nr:SGNH/GDSL hydrolase family protein [Deltaproteobacteria bacterium]